MPELTAQVARAVAAPGQYPLVMRVRDGLGGLFADAVAPRVAPRVAP